MKKIKENKAKKNSELEIPFVFNSSNNKNFFEIVISSSDGFLKNEFFSELLFYILGSEDTEIIVKK